MPLARHWVGVEGCGHRLAEAWDCPQGLTGMQKLKGQYLHDGGFAARRLISSVGE